MIVNEISNLININVFDYVSDWLRNNLIKSFDALSFGVYEGEQLFHGNLETSLFGVFI